VPATSCAAGVGEKCEEEQRDKNRERESEREKEREGCVTV